MLCMPICGKESEMPIGVLQVINKLDGGTFDKEDEKLLQLMLKVAGPMLEFSSLRTNLKVKTVVKQVRRPTMALSKDNPLVSSLRNSKTPLLSSLSEDNNDSKSSPRLPSVGRSKTGSSPFGGPKLLKKKKLSKPPSFKPMSSSLSEFPMTSLAE